MTTTGTLRQAMDENLADFWRGYAMAADHFRIEFPGIIGLATIVPHPVFNGAVLTRAPGADAAALQAALAPELARRATGGTWWLGARASDKDTRVRLSDLGLKADHTAPAMALAPEDLAPGGNIEGFEIWLASTRAERELFGHTAGAAFGFPSGLIPALARMELGPPPEALSAQRRYIGYLDDQPVAVSANLVSRGVVGIYAVATLPEARGRGIGAAMTRRAAQDGFAAGATAAVLQASPMGQPVYARMGFRTIGEYACYLQMP